MAIIHRSGIVCGSWFLDDKVIYIPNAQLENSLETDKDVSKRLLHNRKF